MAKLFERFVSIRATAVLFFLFVSFGQIACSDETTEAEPGNRDCPDGQRFNPIEGCVPVAEGDADTGSKDTEVSEVPDGDVSGKDDTEETASRCSRGRDSDGDGLSDGCECELGTNPSKKDTDGDGLGDGEEDANQNCQVDPGETDPLSPDTDGDGLGDKLEFEHRCLEPDESDTDEDGLADGVEDQNGDGAIGNCPEGEYDVSCANGESNPCKADSDGDGTPDSKEPRLRRCLESDVANLNEPKMVSSPASEGDYKLAVSSSVEASDVSGTSSTINAHVFTDDEAQYTGFVLSYEPSVDTEGASWLENRLVNKIQYIFPTSSRRTSGRKTTTFDGKEASVNAVVEMPGVTSASDGRDKILAELVGVEPTDIQHDEVGSLDGGTGEDNPTVFVFQVVERSGKAVVVGALTSLSRYTDSSTETDIRLDDLTGGDSLARSGVSLVEDCVSYKVESEPAVDIILSMDASDSMKEEQKQLSNFASTFTDLLDDAGVDWRIGVTSAACNNILEDNGVSAGFRDLFNYRPDPSTVVKLCSRDNGLSPSNGELIGGDFTTDAAEVAQRIEDVTVTQSEFTLSMAGAAADRALPRTEGRDAKLRPDADVVLVAVTDEEGDYFKSRVSFLPPGAERLTPARKAAMDDQIQPLIKHLREPPIGATAFGLYSPPGESCGSANSVAHGIAATVSETGGHGGSVCQPDITSTLGEIAEASAGIASDFGIRGTPLPQSIEVKHADVEASSVDAVARDRESGYRYDSVVNRVAFTGENSPETGDRVVISYLRWKDSIQQCQRDSGCPRAQKRQCIKGTCR